VVAMVFWLYIVYEVWMGEASKCNADKGSASSQAAFNAIRVIVTVPWALYPLGYILGGFANKTGNFGHGGAMCWLNAIYNLADLVNKTGFGLAIYSAALMDNAQ